MSTILMRGKCLLLVCTTPSPCQGLSQCPGVPSFYQSHTSIIIIIVIIIILIDHHHLFHFTKHFLSESFSLGLLLFSRKLFRAKRNQTKMTSKDYNVLTYPEGFALTCPCQVGRVPGARVVRGGQGGQGGQVLLQGGGVHAQHFVAHKQEAWEVGKV